MGVTQELMNFLIESEYEQFSDELINRAKILTIDFVGGALAGVRTQVGKILTEYIRAMAAKPEAAVVGSSFKTLAAYASFLNGTYNHAPELESVSQGTSPNPLAAIASALAISDKLRLSGKEFLEGFILGFEIQGRVGGASLAGVSKKGRISIFNYIGAVAAASKLFKLDLESSRCALGIAAFQAGGLITTVGTMAHVLELSVAARDGIQAAELAKKGVTSHPDILEAPQGFCDALIEDGKYDLDQMTMNLGETYQILSPGISVKKYPCCYRSHRALDALFDILHENNISYDNIEKIVVDLNLYDSYLMKFPMPKTGEEAKFSYPHILATAALKGKVWLDSFTDENVWDEKYQEARSKVEVVIHEEWPAGRTDARTPVTLKLKDGRTFSKEVDVPREPIKKELLERYREAADGVLNRERTEKSLDLLLDLENQQNVSDVMVQLTPES